MNIDTFLDKYTDFPIIDVRSPIEYQKGHVPGSVNVPLFSNDERAAIGTLYKKKGQDEAIKLGESYATPKIQSYLKQVREISQNLTVIVYCFRGGLRSRRFCSLLEENNIPYFRLEGGYKAFRKSVKTYFQNCPPLKVVGGKTGTGKTDILTSLRNHGENVIDLEALAQHRGSAFGAIGMPEQPSTESFENILYHEFRDFKDPAYVWVEDESRNIGSVFLPEDFYQILRISPLYILSIPHRDRVSRLCRDYSGCGVGPLLSSLGKIRKRLGSERTTKAEVAIKEGRLEEAVDLILRYYDKCYDYGVSGQNRNIISKIDLPYDNPDEAAKKLISF